MDYLLTEGRALGLESAARPVTVARALNGGPVVAASVSNVAIVLPGEQRERALLVVAHYDTVPGSPGAADNATAVSALLATMRSLKEGKRLRNDVVFLFSDGEEAGRLGAQAFLQNDPNARRIMAVLNFDARGSRGVPVLFETGEASGGLVQRFAVAGPAPFGTSLAGEVYRRMPNDTDFSVFQQAGLPGLNFAAIDGFVHYHTILDDTAHLNPAMLASYTDLVFHLTASLADADLGGVKAPSLVYFTVPGGFLVRYPARWSVALACAALLLVAASMGRGALRGQLRPRRAMICAVAIPVLAAAAATLASQIWRVLRPLADDRMLPQNGGYHASLYLAGFVTLGLASAAVLFAGIRTLARPSEVAWGAAAFSAAAGLVSSVWAQGASYFFVIPAAAAALGVASLEMSSRWPRLSLAICAAAILVVASVVAPVVYLLSIALGAAGLPLVAALAGWTAALLLPMVRVSAGPRHWAPASVLAALTAVLLLTARLGDNFDAAHPRPNAILHLTDTTSRTSVWASTDSELDRFTQPLLGQRAARRSVAGFLPELTRPIWTSDAPYSGGAGVTATIIREAHTANERVVEFQVVVAGRSDVIDLRFAPGCELRGLSAWGAATAPPAQITGSWLQLWAPPPEGLVVTARVQGSSPVRFSAVTRVFGPPQTVASRPDGFIPLPFGFDASDMTAVRSDLSL